MKKFPILEKKIFVVLCEANLTSLELPAAQEEVITIYDTWGSTNIVLVHALDEARTELA